MERITFDVADKLEIAVEVSDSKILELSELQLTFVGGGIADVVL